MTGSAATADRPTRHGQILGEALAAIADAGYSEKPDLPERCLTCAFRAGSMPNQTAGTLRMAMDCLLGIDSDDFACHHGMKDGEPTRLCAGYLAALATAFPQARDLLVGATRAMTALDPAAPDEVRIAFDAWLKEADPERRMDVYEAARAYASAHEKARRGSLRPGRYREETPKEGSNAGSPCCVAGRMSPAG